MSRRPSLLALNAFFLTHCSTLFASAAPRANIANMKMSASANAQVRWYLCWHRLQRVFSSLFFSLCWRRLHRVFSSTPSSSCLVRSMCLERRGGKAFKNRPVSTEGITPPPSRSVPTLLQLLGKSTVCSSIAQRLTKEDSINMAI